MSNASYPTGVENHGGSLRIWFHYNGKRVRENLGKTSVFLTQPKTGRSLVNFALPFVLQSEWGVSTTPRSSLIPLT